MYLIYIIVIGAAAEYDDKPWLLEEFDGDLYENWFVDVVPDSYNNEYQYYTDRFA